MAKKKTAFVCTDCGADFPKWQGQCPACGAWNTLQEFVHDPATPMSKGAGSRGGFSGQLSEVQNLGEIVLAELKDGFSTTATIERLNRNRD